MQIVRDLAGYSMGRSDLVRRAMAKKKHDVMAREKEIFIHGQEEDGVVRVPGCVRNGVSEAIAEQLFDEMTAFASYAFNKSHAAAYAVVAVQTGWLKLHYPVEFMAAMMNSVRGNTGKIAFYIQYCRKNGIDVLPPDINRSEEKFTVDKTGSGKGLRFGLSGIKSLGHNAILALETERQSGGLFRDLYDFINRLAGGAINKKGVESLIRAGAMDSLPGSRSQKLHVYEKAMDGAVRRQKNMVEGQISLFGFGSEATVDAPPPPMPEMKEFEINVLLQMEKETTGVYISGHPLDEYAQQLAGLTVNARFLDALVEEAPDGGMSYDQKTVRMGGLIASKKMKASKNGSMMAFVELEDMYGVTEVLVFPKVYERVSSQLQQDAAVVMTGKLSIREEEAPKLLLDRVAPLRDFENIQWDEWMGKSGAQRKRRAEDVPQGPVQSKKPQHKLYLKLNASQRASVLEILHQTPGDICVMLHMADEKKTYQAPENYWVSEGYLKSALESILGIGNVILK